MNSREKGIWASFRALQSFRLGLPITSQRSTRCTHFRKGNGRCHLALLAMLTDNAGFLMDQTKLDPETWTDAMIESFSGSPDPLEGEILKMLSPEARA